MSTATQATEEKIRIGMATTNNLFVTEVFGKRNFEALDNIYTADAQILPPGAPIIFGRQAIKEFWSNLIQSSNATAATLESMKVMPDGNGVLEIGRATLTIQSTGQAQATVEAKYVVYWQHEDNRWKWHVDIWNQNS